MNKQSNISLIKSALWAVLWGSCILEMIIFPSFDNFIGCMVSVISTWLYFRHILQIEVIRRRVISFIAFLYPFLFMYLPLPATLLDGNEMSRYLVNPIETYLYQLLFFTCAIFAFHLADVWAKRNNGIFNLLCKGGYYKAPTNKQLWILAAIGMVFKLTIVQNQYGEETQAGLGSLSMFSIFIYSPICIMFRPLIDGTQCSAKMKKVIWTYMAFLSVFLISTNSRSQMLSPFVVWGMCYLMEKIYERKNGVWLTFKKAVIGIVAVLVIAGPVTDMGYAMVLVRGERSDLSFSQLLDRSVETFMDKDKLKKAKMLEEQMSAIEKGGNTSSSWNEDYVSNLFMNRLCNYHVVDASIYHADRLGYGNGKMLEDFGRSLMIMFPGPIVKFLFGDIDKSELAYSPMDYLYYLNTGSGLGGYRVGGDVGLGLATFGLFYFPIMIFVFALVFMILNSVARYVNGRAVLPFITLIVVYFSYFLKLQVAGGGNRTSMLCCLGILVVYLLVSSRLQNSKNAYSLQIASVQKGGVYA